MASIVANWVEQTTTTSGTGVITFDTTPPGAASFLEAFGSGSTEIFYSIANGNNREAGYGVYNGATNQLTRTVVTATLAGGVYDDTSPTPLVLSGESTVRCTYNAQAFKSMSNVFVQSGQPSAALAKEGDVWIDTT